MLKYTNGVGHLVMSILMSLIGLALIMWPGLGAAMQGVGIGLILAIHAAWFVPGAAKQVAHEMASQLPATTAPLAPTATPLSQQQQLAFSNQDTMKMQAVKKV